MKLKLNQLNNSAGHQQLWRPSPNNQVIKVIEVNANSCILNSNGRSCGSQLNNKHRLKFSTVFSQAKLFASVKIHARNLIRAVTFVTAVFVYIVHV